MNCFLLKNTSRGTIRDHEFFAMADRIVLYSLDRSRCYHNIDGISSVDLKLCLALQCIPTSLVPCKQVARVVATLDVCRVAESTSKTR